MSDRSTLMRRPGDLSGRIVPRGWTPSDGTHVVCLGSDLPGYTGRFGDGDGARLYTGGLALATEVGTFRGRIRGPEHELPAGWAWWVVLEALGVSVFREIQIPIGVTYDMPDLAIPLTIDDGAEGVSVRIVAVGPVDEIAELEIPAVYLDSFVVGTIPANVGVFNRVPAQAATNVPRAAEVSFSVIATNGSAPDPDQTEIYVNGVLAFSAGFSEPGFTVGSNPYGVVGRNFTIAHDEIFDSQAVVTIRVVSVAGAATIDTSWQFVTADETAPRIVAATSPDHHRVRVSFDEAMRMIDASSSDDVLNPANWTLTPLVAPAVMVSVVGVEEVSPFEVDLILDIPITRAATYRVDVVNVTDVVGNVVDPTASSATFVAYECPVPERRRLELWRLVADTDRERDTTRDLYKLLSLLQEPLDMVLCDIDRWTDILDVDIAAERYVDHMLIQLGNPFRFDLDLTDKRRLVRLLVRIYQQKGTKVGIINVIRFFLGLEVEIVAYNQDGWLLGFDELGVSTYLASSAAFARYAFIVISTVVLTDEQRRRIRELVEYMKPPHTHFVELLEPTPPPSEGTVQWDIGVSLLGVDTHLGDPDEGSTGFPYTFPFVLS